MGQRPLSTIDYSLSTSEAATPQGFEPRLDGPKPTVLPLHHGVVARTRPSSRGLRGPGRQNGLDLRSGAALWADLHSPLASSGPLDGRAESCKRARASVSTAQKRNASRPRGADGTRRGVMDRSCLRLSVRRGVDGGDRSDHQAGTGDRGEGRTGSGTGAGFVVRNERRAQASLVEQGGTRRTSRSESCRTGRSFCGIGRRPPKLMSDADPLRALATS